MDRPHSAIVDTTSVALRCATTHRRSSLSKYPSVTCSPSLLPLPAKSNAKTATPRASSTVSCGSTSTRAEALPCMYITTGMRSTVRSTGSQWEHCRFNPLFVCRVKSVRVNRLPRKEKAGGPRCSSLYFARGGLVVVHVLPKTIKR